MAGARTIGAVVASNTLSKRSSAKPFANLAINDAVAGATMTRSTSLAKAMCLTVSTSEYRFESTVLCESASRVAEPMNRKAF